MQATTLFAFLEFAPTALAEGQSGALRVAVKTERRSPRATLQSPAVASPRGRSGVPTARYRTASVPARAWRWRPARTTLGLESRLTIPPSQSSTCVRGAAYGHSLDSRPAHGIAASSTPHYEGRKTTGGPPRQDSASPDDLRAGRKSDKSPPPSFRRDDPRTNVEGCALVSMES
jgi:hypothetical protein